MSSRRKRAPPARVDEEAKRRLAWDMLEDRRNEVQDQPTPSCSSGPPPSAAEAFCTPPLRVSEERPGPSADGSSCSASLALSVLPASRLAPVWKAVIGEFRVQPARPPPDGEQRGFTLHRAGGQLRLSYSAEEQTWSPGGDGCPAEAGLSRISLEELDWLQRRRVVQLLHQADAPAFKVGIFLLESGLGKPEFLSEGNARLKKANQLLQKLMEYFYDFIIPEVVDNNEEECDTDLERQNVEELYDYVRHVHQRDSQQGAWDVQHKALIPVLRPYQSQAVNWMLRRERLRSGAPKDPSLHFLWRELLTLCGKKLFYNPFTGCLIREFPLSGIEWPGGILADEMGLGKTVEVLALILSHSRQDVQQEALTLPAGKSVNYFVPPPPLERKAASRCRSAVPPRARVSYPTVRAMLVTAIKEMRSGKGASINAVFTYIRATYGYDLLKNRTHIKKTLAKLISEELVEQVKGRGLAGSFRLGKNHKETQKILAAATRSTCRPADATPRKPSQRRAKERAEAALHTALSEDPVSGCPVEEDGGGAPQEEEGLLHAAPASTQASLDKAELQRERSVEEEPEERGGASEPEETPTRASLAPFNTPDYRFECICGELGVIDCKARVQCMNCQLWQHADCVNYKEESLATTPFYCPHCLVAMKPVSTGATLIISPSSICHQWVEEINRHIRSASLRVLVYQGVKKHGFIQPRVLAQQDVVITTYDVLRSELNYVDIPHSNSQDGRRFRNQKRYMAVPSPLVAVEWWRVCLDEAQMVECPTAKAAEMALRLASVNRWCVSGTPVQRGLEDLYGLVLFLGVDPYWVKHWWDQLLYRPYRRGNTEPLYAVVAQILWRSAKKDVIDQIQIPPQTEEVHWLHFSPVEGHFYHRQHEVCSRDALLKLQKISDWSLKLGSLDRRTVDSILYPLLRLRQACCHPQAVRGEFLPLQKSTMTMEELLKSLQKKCRVECEEAHRQLVCALNGLAGIHIIRREFVEAAEMYREVLRSSEEHKDRLKTDSLQRLHATHNLMELLSAKHSGIPPTLRDDRLSEEAEQLRQHYMTKYDHEVADAHQALQPVLQNIKELKRQVDLSSPWWLDVIQKAIRFSTADDLVSRVKNELTSSYKQPANKLSMAEKFRDASGLQFLLSTQMQDLMRSQQTVRDAVKSLEGPASREVIEEATVCHLRPMRLPLNNCVFCKADELFTDYESKLFAHTVKGQTAIFEEMIEDEEGLMDDRLPTTSRGLWAASETERTLKAILSFAKSRRLDPELVEEGNTFMELFENWKKEYKVLHEYWMVLRNHVSAIDELGMATERLRVRLPDEPKPKLLHIIEPHEVEQNRVKLLNDQAVAKSQLQKKLGQFLYLTNLEKSQDKSTGGLNPEPCPICARPLGQEWAVLTCGHCFCNECISIIVEQYSVGSRRRAIKCAICRQTTSHTEISYVFTTQASSQDQDVPVKGSHSTKVEAVVRTLKRIQIRDPGAKCLVFSTWQNVLDIIAKALFDNNMEFSQINGIHKFQENLSSFKYEDQINILLLPLHTGSNGLNIIEATHVLLVEPILNPAHELQAIGRVHRIGQTKPTFVHRFLIKSTIEERMQAMLKTQEKSHSSAAMKHSEAAVLTVADLADLFTEDAESLE
ncbi:E3 ubiquitin-protein ligase SHPRH isoform X1 [Oryzias melastigma]|uniref:SNF2 histone linker PHD RING helicase n=2 Tax=Oryzias melastigma TaxID=30732 RepID=A0A3B3E224_ORYME|nr:E3 ubiquitin-protein ligase SHPRH isoform X1 [Oryzias melastigma]XP_024122384.1 E3 ubiquitin-protein ligase SHPRH isoform X1 [Oryzias melastigma]XP_024122392.1 E3 ubiquitin-protein ligase SHPRH isoform X1 [Oryzias melastigma]XP_036065992.1 E3 ubiquitin-protein ligase SHPRH isoform X1 [Oryzias melastigma]